MNDSLVEKFKRKYETLAGHVHLASSITDAVDIVLMILRGLKAKKLALGDLPKYFLVPLEKICLESDIGVLKPPFNRLELPQAIDSVNVGISWPAFVIAETGTLVEFTKDDSLRLVSTLPKVHIGVFEADDLVNTLREAASPIRKFFTKNSRDATVTFISGPSRTADIEMRLTLGVHGPAVAHAVIIDRKK